jgi:hypothetical protein
MQIKDAAGGLAYSRVPVSLVCDECCMALHALWALLAMTPRAGKQDGRLPACW